MWQPLITGHFTLVNSNKPLNDNEFSSFQTTLEGLGWQFATRAAQVLYKTGNLEFAHLGSEQNSEIPPMIEAKEVINEAALRLGTSAIEAYQVAVALESVGVELENLEEGVLQFLRRSGEKWINTFGELPHKGTLAAELIEIEKNGGLKSGFLAGKYVNDMGVVTQFKERLENLLQNTKLQKKDFQIPLQDFYVCSRSLCDMFTFAYQRHVQVILEICLNLLKIPEFKSVEPTDMNVARLEEDFSQKKRVSDHIAFLSTAGTRFPRLAFSNAHKSFLIKMFDETKTLQRALIELSEIDAPFAPPKDRSLYLENYVYTERLRAQLVALGEKFEEAQKLTASLFSYATRNQVACTEIIDNEAANFNPSISRDIVVRARMEVRLNDINFPLSVAHREWIFKTICSAPKAP